MPTHDDTIKTLLENKAKLEAYEDEIKKNETKRDTLLEQAKQRYGVSSLKELEEYRDAVYEKYTQATEEASKYNAMLEAFFKEVE